MKRAVCAVLGKVHGPAAFRRLCVETTHIKFTKKFPKVQPPSGGCVLKLGAVFQFDNVHAASRLQAAVC